MVLVSDTLVAQQIITGNGSGKKKERTKASFIKTPCKKGHLFISASSL